VLEVRVVVASWLAAAGTDGRVGSVLGEVGLPGWFGFHISVVLPFVYFLDTGPRNNPAGSFPHLRAKSGAAVRFLLTLLLGQNRASREILALLCILTTLGAKLKSPIPNLSGFRGG
jgi:hypothetical protein